MRPLAVSSLIAVLACAPLVVAGFIPPAHAAASYGTSERILDLSLKCIENPDGVPSGEKVSEAPLPGLGRSSVEIVQHAASVGRIFTYKGVASGEIVCGVAYYGPEGRSAYKAVQSNLISSGHFSKAIGAPFSLDSPHARMIAYFNEIAGHGLSGVAILERSDSVGAPGFQMDYHRKLVR